MRLALLAELARHPKCVSDIRDLLDIAQANVSQHLAALRDAEIVACHEQGNVRCCYLLRPELVHDVLRLAHEQYPPRPANAGPSPDRGGQTRQIDKERKANMRVGIIRCQQTEDMCPGNTDFKVAATGKMAFEEIGPSEVVGFVSCGGCPGKRAVARAKMMVDRGAEAIVFASCISRGNPIGVACPHFETMREAIARKVGESVKIIDYTH